MASAIPQMGGFLGKCPHLWNEDDKSDRPAFQGRGEAGGTVRGMEPSLHDGKLLEKLSTQELGGLPPFELSHEQRAVWPALWNETDLGPSLNGVSPLPSHSEPLGA